MKHTAGPWEVTNAKHAVSDTFGIKDANGSWIAKCHPFNGDGVGIETAQANAEFIVRACNLHYELVGACKSALDIINSYSHIPALFRACETLQEGIAKAEIS